MSSVPSVFLEPTTEGVDGTLDEVARLKAV